MQLDPVTGLGIFEVDPVPAEALLPSGIVPQWTSSDVTIATVEQDSTGKTATVTRVSPGSITLTVTLTLADNTIFQDAQVVDVPAVPPPALTGIAIKQVS